MTNGVGNGNTPNDPNQERQTLLDEVKRAEDDQKIAKFQQQKRWAKIRPYVYGGIVIAIATGGISLCNAAQNTARPYAALLDAGKQIIPQIGDPNAPPPPAPLASSSTSEGGSPTSSGASETSTPTLAAGQKISRVYVEIPKQDGERNKKVPQTVLAADAVCESDGKGGSNLTVAQLHITGERAESIQKSGSDKGLRPAITALVSADETEKALTNGGKLNLITGKGEVIGKLPLTFTQDTVNQITGGVQNAVTNPANTFLADVQSVPQAERKVAIKLPCAILSP